MNRHWVAFLAVAASGVAFMTGCKHRTMTLESNAEAAPAAVDPSAVPVLVELFTSEGCSSCPPADAVLAGLERTQPVAGARVVPLGLHVDYWDHIGWPDAFSSARYTERQRAYSALGSGAYTPQAVIDGRAQAIGSRKGAVEQAILAAAKQPHARLTVTVSPRKDASFAITLAVGALPAGSADDAEAIVALTQNAARVAVARGENAGRALEHTAVVRTLMVAGAVPRSGASFEASLKTPPGLDARDVRVVAFVQERASRHVLASATRDLGAAR